MTGDPPIPVTYFYADRQGKVFELINVRRDPGSLVFVTGQCVKTGQPYTVASKYLRATPEEAKAFPHY